MTTILASKLAATTDAGLRLSRFFGTSEGCWVGLQMDYDTTLGKAALAGELEAITSCFNLHDVVPA